MNERQNALFGQNLNVLANATELAVSIVQEVAGDDISSTLGGRVATTADLASATGARLSSQFAKYMGVSKDAA